MTLVRIDKKDKDIIASTIADCNIAFRFYTIENNDLMLQCEIDSDNPAVLWSLGKMAGHSITHQGWTSGTMESFRKIINQKYHAKSRKVGCMPTRTARQEN